MSQSKVVNIDLIKKEREKQNLSFEQMSKLMGYKGSNAYFRKENGDRRFSVEDITKISSILDIPIQSIFFNKTVTKKVTLSKSYKEVV